MKLFLKYLTCLKIILSYLIRGTWILIKIKSPENRLKKLSENVTLHCQKFVKAFNIKIHISNKPHSNLPYLYVSNHMGFVDIICIGSIQNSVFVTSKEMKETPFLGLLTEMAGCLFVDRKNRRSLQQEQQLIADHLKKGFHVVLYPEAHSTDGEKIYPFKGTLMMASVLAQVPLQPAVFNFIQLNKEPASLKFRDSVCWYGKTSFFQALHKALMLKSLDIEIKFLEPKIFPTTAERSQLVEYSHNLISQNYTGFNL